MTPTPMFFIVTKDAPTLRATKRHETAREAREEADRLAAVEGKRFFVFGLIDESGLPSENDATDAARAKP